MLSCKFPMIDFWRKNYEKTKNSQKNASSMIENCKTTLQKSSTQILIPKIISYKSQNRRKILNTLKTKIKDNETLSNIEALSLVMLSRGCIKFTDETSEILEEVCNLLKEINVKDLKFKLELIMEMDCIIHYYARDDEIAYFEEMFGLSEVKTAMEYHEEFLINQAREEGLIQAHDEGLIDRFDLALKVKNKFGIFEALEIFDFSYGELDSEVIDESRFLRFD